MRGRTRISLVASLLVCVCCIVATARNYSAAAQQPAEPISLLRGQSEEEAARKSAGCISCHGQTDEPTMHPTKTVHLACTDCHGGNSSISVATGADPNSSEYKSAKEKAHVQPRDAIFKNRSAVPEIVYAKWLREPAEYVKFVTPVIFASLPKPVGPPAATHPKPAPFQTA
jgi:hypothetical protein